MSKVWSGVHGSARSRVSLDSDQLQFSPDNIRTLSRDTVMRINKMITEEKMP